MSDGKTGEIKTCIKHGDYEVIRGNFLGLEIEFQCPGCVDEAEASRNLKYKLDSDIKQEQKIAKLIENADIPERFEKASLLTYIAKTPGQIKALEACEKYTCDLRNHTGESLFLLGSYGTGKTHLATGILNRRVREGHPGIYTTTMKMIRDIRSSWNGGSKSEQQMIDKYVNIELLVIDEIGVQFGTDAEKVLLFDVLNGRYNNTKSTVLISNLSVIEITAFLTERVMDRLKENGSLVVMEWDSYRRK